MCLSIRFRGRNKSITEKEKPVIIFLFNLAMVTGIYLSVLALIEWRKGVKK